MIYYKACVNKYIDPLLCMKIEMLQHTQTQDVFYITLSINSEF